jgi:regulator of replication initiation timing
MTRLRVAWARHQRNREHWKQLEEAYETIAVQECEKQRLRNEVASVRNEVDALALDNQRLRVEVAELEAELRAYQGVA